MVLPDENLAIVNLPENKEQPVVGKLYFLSSCGFGVTKDSIVYLWKQSDDKTFWRVTTADNRFLSYFHGDTVLVLAIGQTYTEGPHGARRFYAHGAEIADGWALYNKHEEKVLFLHDNGISVLESKLFHPARSE